MDLGRNARLPWEELRRKKCCGCKVLYFRVPAIILTLLFVALAIGLRSIAFGVLASFCAILVCVSCLDCQSRWDNLIGCIRQFTSRFSTGSTDAATEREPGEPQRNRTRRLWESVLDLFRACRRQDTRADSTIDITTGISENVSSPPEYDGSRSQTDRRLAVSEHIRPLNPPYPMITPPKPPRNKEHQNPQSPDLDETIAIILNPISKREGNIEGLNRNQRSNDSESFSSEEISIPQTPLPGPSGIQRRSGGESNETRLGPNETEAEIHTHFRPVSSELGHEDFKLTTEQRHSPMIQRERSPATQQQVMTENLSGQAEESAAVTPRIHRRTSSLDEPFQTEQNDQISEESSSSECASILYSD